MEAAPKKGKKHQKHGRGRRRPGYSRKADRMRANKTRTLNYERKKAGLPPVSPAAADLLRAASRIQ